MATKFHIGKSRRVRLAAGVMVGAMFGFGSFAHPESVEVAAQRSTSATLQICVTVVPILEARGPLRSSPSSDSVVYTMQMPPLAETYEIRDLPPEQPKGEAKRAAILKTLVIVPR